MGNPFVSEQRTASQLDARNGSASRVRLPAMKGVIAAFVLFALGGQVAGNASAAQPIGQLALFSPLVGREWVAEFPGDSVTDTQRFEWALGAKFLRNVHHVRTSGKVVYEGETIYAWDQRAQRIVWWYWNSTGGYVVGTIAIREDGALVAEGENHGAADQLDRVRTVIRIGTDQWTSAGAQERDGKWTEQPPRTYRPVR